MRTPRVQEPLNQAARVLEECGVTQPPVPIVAIVEACDVRLRYSPYEGELAGMLVRGRSQTIIGVNSLHHPNRQRFTIAHELGHYFLHKGDVHIDRSFLVKRRDSVSSQAIDPEEIEANRFAAALLMPSQMVVADLSELDIDIEDETELKKLALKYEVSVQAMTHRITNLLKGSI